MKINIKGILPKSLLYEHNGKNLFDVNRSDVMPFFLCTDCTHLNLWGYQGLMNDLAVPLAGMWGSYVGKTGMWSSKAKSCKEFFLRKKFGRRYNPF